MADNKILSDICYLIPSTATFEGVMDLANGSMATAGIDMVILMVHCAGWMLLLGWHHKLVTPNGKYMIYLMKEGIGNRLKKEVLT